MPPRLQKKALASSSNLLYRRHTTGLAPDKVALAWTAVHKKPVSIVIPSYNDYPLLKACIDSVKATCAGFQYEVIIVDDYCQPENVSRLKSLEDTVVRVIFRSENGGFGKAVNTGMREARHDIVLLNSDIVAQAGWLDSLQHAAYAVDPKIGMVSPKLVYPDGRIQYGGTYHAKVLAPQWFGHLYVGRAANDPVANVAGYNRSISGACVYIKQTVVDELGLLDEAFWLGFEDVDYGLRAWDKGFRCYYQPASMLIHHESATRGYSQGIRELASMRYFWRRWNSTFFFTLPTKKKLQIDYVISSAAPQIWRDFIDSTAKSLKANGHDVTMHVTSSSKVDEKLVATLSPKTSLKICADWGAAETVWLSALNNGKAVYQLQDIESSLFADNPEVQAQIIAGYRPEFHYIVPSRWVRDQLRQEAAWESALMAPQSPISSGLFTQGAKKIVALGGEELSATVQSFAKANDYTVQHIAFESVDATQLEAIAAEQYAAVVYGDANTGNSFIGCALLASGKPLIACKNDKTRYEILDGYNALLFDLNDSAALTKCLHDVLDNQDVAEELSANGILSAGTAENYAELLALQLEQIASERL